MRIQDIHLADDALWKSFYTYWNQGQYSTALDLLNNNSQLVTKYFNSQSVNDIQTQLTEIMDTPPPPFKADRIQVAPVAPEGLDTGKVYFETE